MENNKNSLNLEGSCHTDVLKNAFNSDSSPNYAQDLIDTINTDSNKPFFDTILSRAGESYLKVDSSISPAYNSNQGGLFVQSQEKLSQDAWNILRGLRC